MESVHGLDGRLGAGGVVEADEAEALALVGGAVDEHLGADHVAEREEHLHQLGVAKLLGGELVSFYSSKYVIIWDRWVVIMMIMMRMRVRMELIMLNCPPGAGGR